MACTDKVLQPNTASAEQELTETMSSVLQELTEKLDKSENAQKVLTTHISELSAKYDELKKDRDAQVAQTALLASSLVALAEAQQRGLANITSIMQQVTFIRGLDLTKINESVQGLRDNVHRAASTLQKLASGKPEEKTPSTKIECDKHMKADEVEPSQSLLLNQANPKASSEIDSLSSELSKFSTKDDSPPVSTHTPPNSHHKESIDALISAGYEKKLQGSSDDDKLSKPSKSDTKPLDSMVLESKWSKSITCDSKITIPKSSDSKRRAPNWVYAAAPGTETEEDDISRIIEGKIDKIKRGKNGWRLSSMTARPKALEELKEDHPEVEWPTS